MLPIWKFFIDKRQFTILVMLGLSLWGTSAAFSITKESTPEVQIPVGFSPVNFAIKSRFDPSDAALLALRAASRAKTPLAIKFRFANGSKMAFNSYIAAPLTPAGSSGNVVETPISFASMGIPSVWAS